MAESIAAPFVRRWKEMSATFENVVATGKATLRVPPYDRSLHRIILELGGTTFTKAMITGIVVRWGTKKIYEATGPHLDKLNRYRGDYANASFLSIDFTDLNQKSFAGEFIGALPVNLMRNAGPGKDIIVEVDTSGATAPTLKAHFTWGSPQVNDLLKRLIQFGGAFSNTGTTTGNTMNPDFQGMDLAKFGIIYAGTDWVASAAATAFSGNTGTGTVGTITVSAGAKVGRYSLVITEPGSNVGQFTVFDPDGVAMGKPGTVAAAYTDGSLAFTLSDATDFVPGDGFFIDVSEISDGNVTRAVIQRDSEVIWDRSCHASRFEAKEYGRVPQSKLFMVDFTLDRASPDSLQPTAGAATFPVQVFCTGTDTYAAYAEGYQRLSSIR